MQTLNARETGVLFWATADPSEILPTVTSFGVRCAQIGLRGDLDPGVGPVWNKALRQANLVITSVCAAYNGEDYADIPTVQRTVGFIPRATRAEREERTRRVSDFAAAVGAGGIATHIGVVPHDHQNPDYLDVRDLVRRICDHAASHNQTFALETGQETAPVLLDFIRDVDRSNLGINFDPANMILYGTGDPIDALGLLAKHVFSVHCKDGDWPPKGDPSALGREQPLGSGAVGIPRFLKKLVDIGYRGPLTIEREGVNRSQWEQDVRNAIRLLESLKANAAPA
ncbi:MAG TPA: sugar phosphate isomerase/epimerase family protein [Candidatus Sulfotelmatobacter sp.]|nr:sugar phosphate isomerase/epimerase family protein [Candidatus Sulfotelmatobacter sp.]